MNVILFRKTANTEDEAAYFESLLTGLKVNDTLHQCSATDELKKTWVGRAAFYVSVFRPEIDLEKYDFEMAREVFDGVLRETQRDAYEEMKKFAKDMPFFQGV
jgi:hypothetical protein